MVTWSPLGAKPAQKVSTQQTRQSHRHRFGWLCDYVTVVTVFPEVFKALLPVNWTVKGETTRLRTDAHAQPVAKSNRLLLEFRLCRTSIHQNPPNFLPYSFVGSR